MVYSSEQVRIFIYVESLLSFFPATFLLSSNILMSFTLGLVNICRFNLKYCSILHTKFVISEYKANALCDANQTLLPTL